MSYDDLSIRQRQILKLKRRGMTDYDVAALINRDARTVRREKVIIRENGIKI